MKELVYYPSWDSGKKGYVERIYKFFSEYLARHGLRLTGQRRRIVDLFLESDRHLSQDEIYRVVRKHGLGRATVFRTLKMLEESGLIAHVTGGGGTPRFEVKLDRPHHDHLICVECGAIQEVRWPKLEEIQDEACRKIGFVPKWHRHEVFGRCRDCARKSA